MKAAELEVCKEVLSDAQKSDHGACAGVFLTKWAPKLIKEIERLAEAYAASETARANRAERALWEIKKFVGCFADIADEEFSQEELDELRRLVALSPVPEPAVKEKK